MDRLARGYQHLAGKVLALHTLEDKQHFNSTRLRSSEVPSFNGHGTARGLARFYAALVNGGELDGVRLISESVITEISSEQWSGVDKFGLVMRMAYGFMLSNAFSPFTSNPDSFGHFSIGGSVGFGDPAAKLAFAYCPNCLCPEATMGPYAARLIKTAEACV